MHAIFTDGVHVFFIFIGRGKMKPLLRIGFYSRGFWYCPRKENAVKT